MLWSCLGKSLKRPIAVEIGLLPFTNNRFHCLIAVKSASFPVLLQQPKQMSCPEMFPFSKMANSSRRMSDTKSLLSVCCDHEDQP